MTETATTPLATFLVVLADLETGAVESAQVVASDHRAAIRRVSAMFLLHRSPRSDADMSAGVRVPDLTGAGDWTVIGAGPVAADLADERAAAIVADVVRSWEAEAE